MVKKNRGNDKEKKSGIKSFLKIEKSKVIIFSVILIFGIVVAILFLLNQPTCNEYTMPPGAICPTNPFSFLLPIIIIIFLPLVIIYQFLIIGSIIIKLNLIKLNFFSNLVLGIVILLLSLIYIYLISCLIVFIFKKIRGK